MRQTPSVQRNRGDHVGLDKQAVAGPCQPPAEGRRAMSMIAVLEVHDQRPADLVVAHDRAGPLERRPPRHAGAAQGVAAMVERER